MGERCGQCLVIARRIADRIALLYALLKSSLRTIAPGRKCVHATRHLCMSSGPPARPTANCMGPLASQRSVLNAWQTAFKAMRRRTLPIAKGRTPFGSFGFGWPATCAERCVAVMAGGARASMSRTRSSAASWSPSLESRKVIQCSKREPVGPGPERRGSVRMTYGIAARMRARTSAAKRCVGSGAGMWSPAGRAGTHTHKHTHTQAHRHTHIDTYTHTDTHTLKHAHTNTHTYTHTHTHTDTHTHAHTGYL